ncbi:MAG: response regulator [Aureispira sp.]
MGSSLQLRSPHRIMLDQIVLIDDDKFTNKINQKTIRQLLPNISIQVFENGEEGLSYLINQQDKQLNILVFLDLQMPVMSGFEFLDVYENAIAHQEPPFTICLLSNELEATRQHCLSAYPSVLDYVQKPLNIKRTEDLIVQVTQTFASSQQLVSALY